MPDLNTPVASLILSPRGGWRKAFLISMIGHGCLAMAFHKIPSLGLGQKEQFSTHFDLCFFEPEPMVAPQPPHPIVRPKAPCKNEKKSVQESLQTSTTFASPEAGPPTHSPRALGSNPAPEYPEQARAQGIEGVVHLHVTINGAGLVRHIQVIPPRTSSVLEKAALKAVQEWRFEASPLGLPQEALIPIHFQLDCTGDIP